ncbi:hypothetical protein BH20ACT24_BH20ACT24_23760 [soil metagenome]
MLGAAPGAFLLGDVKKLWSRGARDNQRCGCGKPFLECGFWREVGEAAFGGWSEVDLTYVNRLGDKLHSVWGILGLLSGGERASVAEYGSYVNRLLRAIAELTGSTTIACYAKHPWQGAVLARAADARVRWVHVVRDPRDTAWLWMTGTVKMGGPLPISTAGIVARWGRYNVIPPLLSGIEGVPYLRVRFESLSREPGATLDRVLRFVAAGGHPPAAPVSDHSLIVLDRDTGPCRLVDADFRNQHETAAARLPETDRWRQEMPTMARVAVTAVTLPMMRAFGYAGKTSRHPADEAL